MFLGKALLIWYTVPERMVYLVEGRTGRWNTSFAVCIRGMPIVALTVECIDLFKIVGCTILGWMKSLETGVVSHVRQPK